MLFWFEDGEPKPIAVHLSNQVPAVFRGRLHHSFVSRQIKRTVWGIGENAPLDANRSAVFSVNAPLYRWHKGVV